MNYENWLSHRAFVEYIKIYRLMNNDDNYPDRLADLDRLSEFIINLEPKDLI